MNRIMRRTTCAAVCGLILSSGAAAFGQDDPVIEEPASQPSAVPEVPPDDVEESPPPVDEQEVTAEELQAIEAALAADAEEPPPSEPALVRSADGSSALRSADGSPANFGVGYDLALILDAAAAWFSDEPRQLGGHDPNHTGFTLQQLEMSIGASVDPFFRLDTNIVFSQFGVEVEEAYATTLALPGNLQMRGGQFLTQFGRLNPTHPHAWQFLDQPLVNGKFFGSEASRGVGAEVSWLTPLPWYVDLTASATEGVGECCARSFYGGEDLGVETPADLLYTTRIAQFFPLGDALSLLWGVSAQFGPNPTGLGNRTEIYGSDLYLRYKPVGTDVRTAVSLQLEGMFRTRQVPGDVLQDGGGRAELTWDLTKRWQTAARYELVSGVEQDPLDPEWTSGRQRVAAQATFFPSHFSRIRLQVARDSAEWFEAPVYAAMLGLEVMVGAHGAHEF